MKTNIQEYLNCGYTFGMVLVASDKDFGSFFLVIILISLVDFFCFYLSFFVFRFLLFVFAFFFFDFCTL